MHPNARLGERPAQRDTTRTGRSGRWRTSRPGCQTTVLKRDDLKSFTVQDDGVVFHFGPYHMGPYAQGQFDIPQPWARIRHMLPVGSKLAAVADEGSSSSSPSTPHQP